MTALIVKDHTDHELFVGVTNNPQKLMRKLYNDKDLSIMMFHTEGKNSICEACRILYQLQKVLVLPFSDMWYVPSVVDEPIPLSDILIPSEDPKNRFDLSKPMLKNEVAAL